MHHQHIARMVSFKYKDAIFSFPLQSKNDPCKQAKQKHSSSLVWAEELNSVEAIVCVCVFFFSIFLIKIPFKFRGILIRIARHAATYTTHERFFQISQHLHA